MNCKECNLEMELNHRTLDGSRELWVCWNDHFEEKMLDATYKERANEIMRLLWVQRAFVPLSALEYWLTELKPDWREFTANQLAEQFLTIWNSPEMKQMNSVPFGWALDPKELNEIAPLERFK